MEIRAAAVVVLGELRVKQPSVTQALVALLDDPVPVMRRHALTALAKTGAAGKALPKLFPMLTSNVEEVRRAAAEAIASIGESVVPTIRARMPAASAEEKRALDAILAELGGRDAFGALLAGLAASSGEAAKAAALAMRQRIREADARERKSYLGATEKFLAGLGAPRRKGKAAPAAAPDEGTIAAKAAALKILGYLEDPRATPTLLAHAANAQQAPAVRQEALIALRFVLGRGKPPSKLFDVLVGAAEAADRTLAQTALHTLGALELPPSAAGRLERLLAHPDVERARFAAEYLGRQGSADATKALVHAVCALERRRAELAASALEGKEEAVAPLAKALLATRDADRSWLIRNVLRSCTKKVAPSVRQELLDAALARLGDGARGWEAALDVVRDADPDGVAEALRALGRKLDKNGRGTKARTVIELLCRSDRASDDDRYQLCSLELREGALDTSSSARASDPALGRLATLLGRGFDLAAALRKDKALGPEHLYYVGFHFTEAGQPLGEELLEQVASTVGRGKLGRMAKNKLSLVQSGS